MLLEIIHLLAIFLSMIGILVFMGKLIAEYANGDQNHD